ncbi:MAG: zinc ribbon domain-containing protein [Halobacteriota archaeon]
MPSDDSEYSVFEETDRSASDDHRGDRSETNATNRDTESPTPETAREDGCPKCGCQEVDFDKISTSGTGLTKLFDVQNRQFTVVSCVECGYSELYRGQSQHNVVDFFFG